MNKTVVFYFFLLFFSLTINAQHLIIRGHIVDRHTGKPLAFVNILYGSKEGVTSSIDGDFAIETSHPISQLQCSFLGYRDTVISIASLQDSVFLDIALTPTSLQLNEVKVLPGENPAEILIKRALAHKQENNPEAHLNSLSYSTYNKLYMTVKSSVVKELKTDTVAKPKITEYTSHDSTIATTKDSQPQMNDSAKQFLEKHHLFLIETVKESFFKRPNKHYQRVIASKVSGFTIPTLFGLATELQSFSFYTDKISLLGNNYLSPLSDKSYKHYLFILEDSLFIGEDTVYVISFQPHKSKKFNALKGIMYLRTPSYAVSNVIAEPATRSPLFHIRIQQKYQYFEHRQWMPKELYATFSYTVDTSKEGQIIGVNKTYVNNIHLNPDLDSIRFGSIAFEFNKDAFHHSQEQWKTLRTIPLTPKEKATYHYVDSLGKKNHFNRLYSIYNILLDGSIPLGKFDWNLSRLLDFNFVEGFRVQGDLSTSHKFSKFFKISGYLAYGFHDRQTKYGGSLSLLFNSLHNIKWSLSHQYDVKEFGGFEPFYNLSSNLFSSNNEGLYRQFISGLYYFQNTQSALSFRILNYLKGTWETGILQPQSYRVVDMTSKHSLFLPQASLPSVLYETTLRLKYAYGDKIMKALDKVYYQGTRYPIVWAVYKRGFQYAGKGQDFEKIQFKIEKHFAWKNLWETDVNIQAGLVRGDYPLFYAFNGKGVKTFMIDFQINNSFQTIRQYEFFADQIASFYVSHSFGKWHLSTQSTPRLRLTYGFETGTLDNPSLQQQYHLQDLRYGYHEGGLIIENLWNGTYSSYGIGIFYRMGHYAFVKPIDNFAFTFVSRFNLN